MSNRRRPTRTVITEYHVGTPTAVARMAAAYACPDCSSVTSRHNTPGILHLEVAHDESCPWWRQLQASRRRPA